MVSVNNVLPCGGGYSSFGMLNRESGKGIEPVSPNKLQILDKTTTLTPFFLLTTKEKNSFSLGAVK